MSNVWEDRIAAWLRSEQQRQATAAREGDALRHRAAELAASIDRAIDAQTRRAADATRDLKRLMAMQEDPLVLARNYGANRTVYHHPSAPCGWVGSRRGYDSLLLTEATERGLRPCSSCGYLVGRSS